MPAMPPGRRRAAAAAGRAILFAAAALALCVCCDGGSEEGRSPRQRGGWAQAAQELLARPGAPPTLAEANLTVAGLLRHLAPAITRGFVPHTLAGEGPPPAPHPQSKYSLPAQHILPPTAHCQGCESLSRLPSVLNHTPFLGAVYGVDDSGVPNGAPSEAALEAPQAQNCSYADKQV